MTRELQYRSFRNLILLKKDYLSKSCLALVRVSFVRGEWGSKGNLNTATGKNCVAMMVIQNY